MRRLILLRHAKSDRSRTGERDRDRVLAKRGREAAPRMGAYMASHGLRPDLVVCSAAVHTRETWELVALAFDEPPPVVFTKASTPTTPTSCSISSRAPRPTCTCSC